jgi:hypothetical protein
MDESQQNPGEPPGGRGSGANDSKVPTHSNMPTQAEPIENNGRGANDSIENNGGRSGDDIDNSDNIGDDDNDDTNSDNIRGNDRDCDSRSDDYNHGDDYDSVSECSASMDDSMHDADFRRHRTKHLEKDFVRSGKAAYHKCKHRLRDLVQRSLDHQKLKTAVFYADKLVSLSGLREEGGSIVLLIFKSGTSLLAMY